MDWLGGLSSIKGQITNITKDLLAEGTREINDKYFIGLTCRAIIAKLRSEVSNERGEPEGQPEASVSSASSHIDADAPNSGRRQYPG
ncbi:unnamed protein product [Trichobilharzia regenti]|nr:unnamed protein product [Trichobilharzia regenti]